MPKKKTTRLILPQWQGGCNPNYAFGAELLAFIAPPSKEDKTILVDVNMNFDEQLKIEHGVAGERILLTQLENTKEILWQENPDKVIVFGGDCSISQAPFDYLSGRYGETLGVLWLDAHPDISTTAESAHNHEMVLGNIIGCGAPQFAARMQHPVKKEHVMYAGLIERELRDMDKAVFELNMRYADPSELTEDSIPILTWIKEKNISHIAVHFDLDVISPDSFRSNTTSKPYQTREEYGAAIGELTLEQVIRILKDVEACAEIVGLCIAEHMPWDAMNLRGALEKLSIFQ